MSTGSLRVRVCLSRFRITFSIEDFSCEWRCRVSQTIIVDLGRLLLSTDINRSWEATGKRTTLIPINLAHRLLINYPRFGRQFRRLKARGFIPLLLCTWGCILSRCGSGLLHNSVYPDKKKYTSGISTHWQRQLLILEKNTTELNQLVGRSFRRGKGVQPESPSLSTPIPYRFPIQGFFAPDKINTPLTSQLTGS